VINDDLACIHVFDEFPDGTGASPHGVTAVLREHGRKAGTFSSRFVGAVAVCLVSATAIGTGGRPTNTQDFFSDALEPQSDRVAPAAEEISDIRRRLKLTITDLALALRVERVTLYLWMKGTRPRAESADRLHVLSEFSRLWEGSGLGSARAYWNLRPAGASASLRSILTAPELSLATLAGVVRSLATGSSEVAIRKPKMLGYKKAPAKGGLGPFAPRVINED